MRHGIYAGSVGGWTKYAAQMERMIELFKQHVPRLREKGALPFYSDMNWKFDPNFDYQKTLDEYGRAKKSATSADGADKDSNRHAKTEAKDGKKSKSKKCVLNL